ncbi:MAG TPA: hypothetical protein VK171_09385 [Fimbriimonas sp.]|nr:hypothetical protein [Fimbriimonas sp.]
MLILTSLTILSLGFGQGASPSKGLPRPKTVDFALITKVKPFKVKGKPGESNQVTYLYVFSKPFASLVKEIDADPFFKNWKRTTTKRFYVLSNRPTLNTQVLLGHGKGTGQLEDSASSFISITEYK